MSVMFNIKSYPSVLACTLLLIVSAIINATANADELTPRASGPISVHELGVLLGTEVLFKIFDFEIANDFCLHTSIRHEVDGVLMSEGPSGGECWTSGPTSLIFRFEQVDDYHRVTFAVHNRETGGGGSFSPRVLSIGKIKGWDMSLGQPKTSVEGDQELLSLSLTEINPETLRAGSKHNLQIMIRFEPNPTGILGTP